MDPTTPLLRSSSHKAINIVASSLSAEPGQTPPLSVLFPSPRRRNRAFPSLDAPRSGLGSQVPAEMPTILASLETDSPVPLPSDWPSIMLPRPGLVSSARTTESSLPPTPLSVSRVLRKKLMLEALPSPALVPPSPFELEPHRRSAASPKFAQGVLPEFASVSTSDCDPHHVLVKKLEGLRVSEAEALPSDPADSGLDSGASDALVPKGTPGESPSPMLTLESMRVAWDANAREGIAQVQAAAKPNSALRPSLSRRRMS